MLLLAAVGLCSAHLPVFRRPGLAGLWDDGALRALQNINTLSHAEIDKLGTPSLITRITNDVNQLQVA